MKTILDNKKSIEKYNWKRLNHLQIGKLSEYYVKMEFTLYGFDVYTSEVDDKGIDFVVRTYNKYYDVQVKSVRRFNYIFFPKSKFELSDNLFASVVVYLEKEQPYLFIIPSIIWRNPNSLFKDYDYEGKKSKPEYGLQITRKNWDLLKEYSFEKMINTLL